MRQLAKHEAALWFYTRRWQCYDGDGRLVAEDYDRATTKRMAEQAGYVVIEVDKEGA